MTDHTRVLEALADGTRRSILEQVAEQPRSVGELADGLPVSRPAVSQHLKVLTEAGLVVSTAQGTRRIYRFDPRGVLALRTYLDGFWQQSLEQFRTVAEQTLKESR
jgi:DNA-binding transcriptional ArsR family regulator